MAAATMTSRMLTQFIEKTGIPYLAMPMAKGLIPDTHDQSAAAARSFTLGSSGMA